MTNDECAHAEIRAHPFIIPSFVITVESSGRPAPLEC